MLHQDEAVGIILAGAELNIAPLQSHQFASPQTGTQGGHEEGVNS
jgi:hypothetical protein